MKKTSLFVILGVVAVLAIWIVSSYNRLINTDETVTKAWANVESQYQRRADLIPNLVNTVKGYAQHESQTLEDVVAARAKATSIQIDPSNITPEELQAYQEAQNEVGGALGKLLAVAENYPDLKANENFRDLQVQLEGTENRIQKSRSEYNDAVREYNLRVRRFPGNIVASIFGFGTKNPFQSEAGSEKAPTVTF